MNGHVDAIIGALIASTVLSLALLYVRSFANMRPGLGWWAAGFGLNALRLAIYLGAPALHRDLAGFAAEYFQAVQSVLLLAGTMAFLGREMSTRTLATACGLIGVWAATGTFVLRSFLMTTIPLYLATGLILMWSGILLLRDRRGARGAGRTITGTAFILWGLHKLNFPFLRTVDWFAPWGFMIAQTLALIAAVGIIVMALRSLQKQTEWETTERLAAQEALRASEELYRTAFRTSPDAINLNRLSDGLYVDVNKGFSELTGYGREDVIGRTSAEIGIWTDPGDRERLVAGLKEHGRVSNLRAVFRRKDGGTTTALMSARILSLHGEPHILSVTRDISRLRQAEEAVRESERRLRLVLGSTGEGIYAVDPEGRCTLCNPAAARILGYDDPEDLLGCDIHGMIHHSRADGSVCPREECQIHRAAARGEPVHADDEVFWRRDGQAISVEVRSNPVIENGKVTGNVVSFSDIGERKRAEAWLLRLSQSVEQSPFGVVIADAAGKIEYLNPSFTRETGYELADIKGRPAALQNADGPESPSARQIWQTISTGCEWRGEIRHRRKNGEVYWASIFISPILDRNGEIVAYVDISEDITERRQVADHLRQAQKMEAVGQLTGGVAHDFNNILSVIQLNAEILAEDLEGDMASGGPLARIVRSVQRATELTERLLAFSRRRDLLPEVVEPGPAVRDTVEMLRRSLGETISVTVRAEDDVPAVVVDRGQFENALLNLAINARDAMPEGGSLTIGIDRDQPPAGMRLSDSDFVCLTVTDSGTGMPPEIAERIFEPFFTTKGKGQGTGLGLSMVYGFVRQSGGDILVDSVEGEGTTFRLYFPAARRAIVDETAETVGRDEAADDLPAPLTILVAEDDEGVRAATRMILAGYGHRVIQAANGREAFDVLKRTPDIDLLLTDVVMPGGMSGRDLCDLARQLYPELKILFASGYAKGILSIDDMEPGLSAFIPKPYTKEGLMRAIASLWFSQPIEKVR